MSNVVNLWQVRESVAPAALLANISAYCEELGVTSMDVYGDAGPSVTTENSWLRRFECEVATALGMGNALFLPSGTMGQQIALCIHGQKQTQSPLNSGDNASSNELYFICHHTSHLLLHEFDSYDSLLGMHAIVIPPTPNSLCLQPVTYDSFMTAVSAVPSNRAHARLSAAIIECPHREIGGKCTSMEDLVKISSYCRANSIKLHLDGARLWEAQAAYCSGPDGVSLQNFCSLFDSIYVSFYKGLGAITGAMLLAHPNLEDAPAASSTTGATATSTSMHSGGAFETRGFIAQAREWQKRFGGGLFSVLPYAVSCWHQYRRFGSGDVFVLRRDRLRTVVAAISTALQDHMLADEPLLRFDPPVPAVCLVHVHFGTTMEILEQARQTAVAHTGIAVYARARPAVGFGCYSEFNMGDLNGSLSTECWIAGYTALLKEIVRITSMLNAVRRVAAVDAKTAFGNVKSSSPVR